MKRFFYLLLLVGFLLGITGVFAVFMPNTPDFEGKRGVKIPPQSSFQAVMDSLDRAGILNSPLSFELVASVTGWRRQIKPGYYEIAAGQSNFALLDKLRKGLQDPIRVTIPPGTRPARLASLLANRLDVDSTAVRMALADDAFTTELGTDPARLFGYLMPDTYLMYWRTAPQEAIRRVKREFDQKWTTELQNRATALNLTVDQVLTLASIVEWEALLETEKSRIAGVYLNRLNLPMRLQADPTVQFALMEQDGGPMRRLSFRDYRFDHPYNTYQIDGLPPGPLNNPAFSTVMAVLYPEEHPYLYFVANGEGGHTFSRTLSEHNRAARAYRAFLREREASR